jgi:hypothetical protein
VRVSTAVASGLSRLHHDHPPRGCPGRSQNPAVPSPPCPPETTSRPALPANSPSTDSPWPSISGRTTASAHAAASGTAPKATSGGTGQTAPATPWGLPTPRPVHLTPRPRSRPAPAPPQNRTPTPARRPRVNSGTYHRRNCCLFSEMPFPDIHDAPGGAGGPGKAPPRAAGGLRTLRVTELRDGHSPPGPSRRSASGPDRTAIKANPLPPDATGHARRAFAG